MEDMKRTISLNGIPTAYTLERKRVKNVNLRVRGGEVFVSAPRWVPPAVIDGFLRERADFILGALERTERTPFPPCEDGAALPWRGRTLTLALGRGSRSSARVEGGVLRLCVRDAQDAEGYKPGMTLQDFTANLIIHHRHLNICRPHNLPPSCGNQLFDAIQQIAVPHRHFG